MSTPIATQQYILNSALGNVIVTKDLVQDFDVEDIAHTRAISQALLIQFINIGNTIDQNSPLPSQAIPSVFTANGVSLDG